jgi:uncharacterized protein (TIGR02270 family)
MENQKTNIDRIAITGIGLVTSLGLSAPSSLAAIRSGIANFIEHETVLVNGNEYGTELCGAIIARLPEQVVSRRVHGADRAVALLAPAIRECTDGLPHSMLENAHWRMDSSIESGNGNFTENLRTELRALPFPAQRANAPAASALGRCLFFENIIQAITDLRTGACQMALVGCVDSLCESSTLDKLAEEDRLKSGTNPEGIVAGEAAGVVLLELESHARKRNAAIHAYINAWGQSAEPNPWTGTTPSTAKGLTSAFHEAFAQLPGKGEEIDMVIADLNGERARAHEWAFTSGRIFPVDAKARELMHPADCTGDCGAALGSVLLATAAKLMSGILPPLNIALATSDDDGARRILCLEKGDDRDQDALILNEQQKRLTVLPVVIEQHNDETPFLWLRRNRLVTAPHCGLHELAWHDQRIEANLDGLRLAGDAGWELSKEALRHGNAGDYFSAAFLAFKSGDEERISCLLDKRGTVPEMSKGIISALGWLPYSQAEPFITKFLADSSPALLRIGIAASAIHGIDPGKILKDAIRNEDQALKARSLKAVGELGRIDLLPVLVDNYSHEDEACRFFAAWSAALLGDRNALALLKSIAAGSSLYREETVKTAFRMMEGHDTRTWHAVLASNPVSLRLAVIGAGTAGDPALVPWLIEQMRNTELARVAGEAFTMITGADIVRDGLNGDVPYEFDEDPDDDPEDDSVAMDPDENLPWPDPGLVSNWWQQHGNSFDNGRRCFLGKSITADHLRQALYSGSQYQRSSAAMESALLNPGLPLFNTRAPGFRQVRTT